MANGSRLHAHPDAGDKGNPDQEGKVPGRESQGKEKDAKRDFPGFDEETEHPGMLSGKPGLHLTLWVESDLSGSILHWLLDYI